MKYANDFIEIGNLIRLDILFDNSWSVLQRERSYRIFKDKISLVSC